MSDLNYISAGNAYYFGQPHPSHFPSPYVTPRRSLSPSAFTTPPSNTCGAYYTNSFQSRRYAKALISCPPLNTPAPTNSAAPLNAPAPMNGAVPLNVPIPMYIAAPSFPVPLTYYPAPPATVSSVERGLPIILTAILILVALDLIVVRPEKYARR